MTVKRFGRRLLIVLAFLTGTAFWAFRNVRRWLMVDDTLQRARAMVVLSGLVPYSSLAGFQVTIIGRFWVTAEALVEPTNLYSSVHDATPCELLLDISALSSEICHE